LRVYPDEEDIDYKLVRDVLRIRSDDIRLEFVEEHEDNFLILQFSEALSPREREAATKTPQALFVHATAWLREMSESQVTRLKEMGLRADLYVGGYWGAIPNDLIREVVRLGLGFWIS
jgi:hypothetical protein